MHYHQGFHRFVTARDFADYTTDAFDTLWAEGERAPKMMSIGLHLRMIGRPGRIAALDRIVAHMNKKGGAWFATRRQIAEHWITKVCVHVVLSEAKDLIAACNRHEILRCAQDD